MLRLIRPLRTAAAVTVARSAPPLLSHRKPAVIAAAAATGLFAALIELTSSPASAWCEQAAGPYLTANFIADAAAKASPALVHIRVSGSYRQASGSGFVVDPSGIVLTNTHVIGDALSTSRFGGGTVSVTLSDGITELPGVVQHADPISDIAIVKVQSPRPLPAVRLGSSAALRVGEFVVALGSPAGLTNSVSAGIVSSVERTRSDLGLDRRNRAGNARAMHYIQTDAAINQGNSGGPLLNLAGEVIGVNTMKVSGADGIAFAVPIDEVKRVVSQLQRHGKVLRPYLGLRFLELDAHTARHLERSSASSATVPDAGLLVMQVAPDSPAQRGGVREGDTIVGLDGRRVHTTRALLDGLADKVGQRVQLELRRGDARVASDCHVESMQQ